MKFLLYVHIAFKVRNFLRSKGLEAVHVNEILDKWYTTDSQIGIYADLHGYIVLTKDMDFRNSFLIKRSPGRIVRICLGNISNDDLIRLLNKYWLPLEKIASKGHFYCELYEDDFIIFDP